MAFVHYIYRFPKAYQMGLSKLVQLYTCQPKS